MNFVIFPYRMTYYESPKLLYMKLEPNFCTILEIMATTKLEVQKMGLYLQALCCIVILVHYSSKFCKLERLFMQRSNKFGFQRLEYFQVKLFNKIG